MANNFLVFMEYYNNANLLGSYPLKLVCKYFCDYFSEHQVQTSIIHLMKWADTYTITFNEFIVDLYPHPHSPNKFFNSIIKSSNLSLLKWYTQNQTNFSLKAPMLDVGFQVGCLDILQWGFNMGIIYTWENFHTAIQFGHLHVLHWMHHQKIIMKSFKQYNYKFFDWQEYIIDTDCCTIAVRYNQMDILE